MIDEIMPPIASMLAGNKIVALLIGRVLIGHLFGNSIDCGSKSEAGIMEAGTLLWGVTVSLHLRIRPTFGSSNGW